MDAFDETVQKTKSAIDIVIKKTGDFVSVSKLKISLNNLESKLAKSYAELGKLQYRALKDDEIEDMAVASAVFEIRQNLSEIKALLKEIEKAEGKRLCPKCKSKVPTDSVFCNKCGERF